MHITTQFVLTSCYVYMFKQGLLMKAEAYYHMMQFEYALMFYHRGNKMRPEVQAFRLGIQKSQEAIENCIGGQLLRSSYACN